MNFIYLSGPKSEQNAIILSGFTQLCMSQVFSSYVREKIGKQVPFCERFTLHLEVQDVL